MLNLPNVTLVSIDSVHDHKSKNNIRLAAVSKIVNHLSDQIKFGDYLFINPFNKNKDLITDYFEPLWPMVNGIESNPIMWYSNFLIKKLPHLIKTDWYLIIQWDGFPVNTNMWDDKFFEYPFLGGGDSTYNGGFSLRNTKTMIDLSKINDDFSTGAEDGFYSIFLDNEWMSKHDTPLKLKWASSDICKKFCNFDGMNGDIMPDNFFGWHRSHYTSEQFFMETYRNIGIFSGDEIDKLKQYGICKSIKKELLVDSYIKEFDIDYHSDFFEL
jgi:hypothetical protein